VPPDAIGYRAMAVNLSDLAAMGSRPRLALLSLALPDALPIDELDALLDGMLALAAAHKVAIAGGNITRSPGPMMIDVTAVGSVRQRRILRRAGAHAGDEVYVTGRIGDAAAGLQILQAGGDASGCCARRFLRPEPRVKAGWLLGANRAATACIDLSDGLADGVRLLAEASGVGITIDERAVPVSAEAAAWFTAHTGDPVTASICGGDDYELLFTVRPKLRGRLRHVQRASGNLPMTCIGIVTKGRDVLLKATDGKTRPLPTGYEHFRPSA
jgi:thiamine-monophosphate kinase